LGIRLLLLRRPGPVPGPSSVWTECPVVGRVVGVLCLVELAAARAPPRVDGVRLLGRDQAGRDARRAGPQAMARRRARRRAGGPRTVQVLRLLLELGGGAVRRPRLSRSPAGARAGV